MRAQSLQSRPTLRDLKDYICQASLSMDFSRQEYLMVVNPSLTFLSWFAYSLPTITSLQVRFSLLIVTFCLSLPFVKLLVNTHPAKLQTRMN